MKPKHIKLISTNQHPSCKPLKTNKLEEILNNKVFQIHPDYCNESYLFGSRYIPFCLKTDIILLLSQNICCWHRFWAITPLSQKPKGGTMKKKSYNKPTKKTFYDDTFSYFNLESSDSEALYEGEIEMDHLLEDYHIEDLDLTELSDNIDDEISLI